NKTKIKCKETLDLFYGKVNSFNFKKADDMIYLIKNDYLINAKLDVVFKKLKNAGINANLPIFKFNFVELEENLQLITVFKKIFEFYNFVAVVFVDNFGEECFVLAKTNEHQFYSYKPINLEMANFEIISAINALNRFNNLQKIEGNASKLNQINGDNKVVVNSESENFLVKAGSICSEKNNCSKTIKICEFFNCGRWKVFSGIDFLTEKSFLYRVDLKFLNNIFSIKQNGKSLSISNAFGQNYFIKTNFNFDYIVQLKEKVIYLKFVKTNLKKYIVFEGEIECKSFPKNFNIFFLKSKLEFFSHFNLLILPLEKSFNYLNFLFKKSISEKESLKDLALKYQLFVKQKFGIENLESSIKFHAPLICKNFSFILFRNNSSKRIDLMYHGLEKMEIVVDGVKYFNCNEINKDLIFNDNTSLELYF
ncbi:MAG: hypothetical protein RR400_02935, partial [Clostridia bacterium]